MQLNVDRRNLSAIAVQFCVCVFSVRIFFCWFLIYAENKWCSALLASVFSLTFFLIAICYFNFPITRLFIYVEG